VSRELAISIEIAHEIAHEAHELAIESQGEMEREGVPSVGAERTGSRGSGMGGGRGEIECRESCVVCLVEPRSHVFIPCMHVCVCEVCAMAIGDGLCPLCRTEYSAVTRVYL
jgi:hypothetical protein